MLPMSLARLLVTLLVADAALVGPPVAAPTATFADDQATRGLRTVESAEKTCLYDGLRVLLPHAGGSPLTTRGTTPGPHRVPPTAEGTTKDIADVKTMSYKTTNEMTLTCCAGASAGQDPRHPNDGARRVGTSADATARNADTEAKIPIETTTIAQHPRMCPAKRPGELINHFGEPRVAAPAALPGDDTVKDAAETPESTPSTPVINTKNTVDLGGAVATGTGGRPPDTLTLSCPLAASPPRHLHTNDQDLPPEDSATTNNTAKNVGQGSTLLRSARDNVGKEDEVSLVLGVASIDRDRGYYL